MEPRDRIGTREGAALDDAPARLARHLHDGWGDGRHEFPTSWGAPATVRLTIRIVIFDVVATAPVSGFTVPVVGLSLMSCAVAVTGTTSSLNEPVASGSDSFAVTLSVVRSAVAVSLPGPSGSVALGLARWVLPDTGYLSVTVVSADVVPALASTPHPAMSAVNELITALRILVLRADLIM